MQVIKTGLVGILLSLVACSQPTVGGGKGLHLEEAPGIKNEPTLMSLAHLTPTWTVRPTRHRSPTPTITPVTPTRTYTPSPSDTPTPLPPFVICSPMVTLTLENLWRDVGSPYMPPLPGSDNRHQGIDITYYQLNGELHPIEGDGVQTVLAGEVVGAISDSYPFGNVVIIETRQALLPEDLVLRLKIEADQSLYLLYAHMQPGLQVSLGEMVTACQPLGKVGDTGNTDAPHLHLETRRGPAGEKFLEFGNYQEGQSELARQNYKRWRISGIYIHFDPMLLLDPRHLAPTVTPTDWE